jgi:hypothetical protein
LFYCEKSVNLHAVLLYVGYTMAKDHSLMRIMA